jgi:uncharacterized Fe-S radical SAM superfamily protein PflX
MGQYRPCGQAARRPEEWAEIGRSPTGAEMAEAFAAARAAGLHRTGDPSDGLARLLRRAGLGE